MREFLRKLAGLLRRDRIAADLREEMQTHLEMKAAASGDPRASILQFGNVDLHVEDSRAVWGWPAIEAWLRDFRYAFRGIARRPSFAATVVLTLAIGIGASTTIYALIDTVLLRPLPYPEADRLVALREGQLADSSSRTPVAPGRLEDWQRLNKTFEAIAGSHQDTLTDSTDAQPERINAAFVSPRFFSVLRTPAQLGRVFAAEEERFGGPKAVLISDAVWRRRFGADPGALGRSITLSDERFTIIGVMPSNFRHPQPATEVWVPKQARPGLMLIREARSYSGVGLLKPGVTLEQAQKDLNTVQAELGKQYPKTDSGWNAVLTPLKEEIVGKARKPLWLLFGSVSLLLMITLANVACLLLSRLNTRAVEIATRWSLGAGSAAITRQLFAEGLVYAAAGGLFGFIAAAGGIGFLRTALSDIPRVAELAVDGRVLALVAGICLIAACMSSVAPILHVLRSTLTASLVRAGRGMAAGKQRLPRLLVSAQFALATALLIGSGLFIQSLLRLQQAPLGFKPENVLTLRIGATFSEPEEKVVERHRRTLEALSSIPGVTAVAMSSGLPGVNSTWPREFEIVGEASPDGTLRFARRRIVTAGYFRTLGIQLLDGESCRMSADPKQPFEALVNRTFADRYFRGRSPLGHHLAQGPHGDTALRIVGVVAEAREDGHGVEPPPLIYACGYLRYWPDSDYLIQTSNPAALASAARSKLRALEPARPIYGIMPMAQALRGALGQARFRTLLVGLFSMLALLLAAVGLYGVMAYMVSQRTHEIGLRMTLGARPALIAAGILRSACILAASGAAAGIGLAAIASKLMSTLLYGARPSDATAYISAVAVLFLVAMLACLVPGLRATSIDPTEALRAQ